MPLLEHIAWSDISALQKSAAGLLILPLGATEQHGPHLPIGMDSLLADSLCQQASDLTGIPTLQTLRVTASQGHTAKWPGTFSLNHETLISTLTDIADWAVSTGWKKLLFVNTHFGNDAPTRVAVDKIRLKHMGTFQIGLINAFQLTDSIWKNYTQDADDLHANQAETALIMHLYPDLVHLDRLTEADDSDRTQDTVFSYPVAQTSRNGVTGFPSRATTEQGAALFQEMLVALCSTLERAKQEKAPLA